MKYVNKQQWYWQLDFIKSIKAGLSGELCLLLVRYFVIIYYASFTTFKTLFGIALSNGFVSKQLFSLNNGHCNQCSKVQSNNFQVAYVLRKIEN